MEVVVEGVVTNIGLEVVWKGTVAELSLHDPRLFLPVSIYLPSGMLSSYKKTTLGCDFDDCIKREERRLLTWTSMMPQSETILIIYCPERVTPFGLQNM